ncbi:hypothetical protein KVT40_002588 [Elsinoe batatas]|uniref:F-box domain-containing protein n=1 Tax=Elsinoe batatas TaxID=2601811 RepID=A0A8K0PIP5_9PEZI|nr:hypothetical protein KVT40_002588 [Elsinoe batatas]
MVQLPVEVRHMVAGHLSRPLDLKKLCLTNKDWYDPAVKVLYNEMYLLIGGDKDRNLVYTFNPQNHALGHIRGLDIKVIEGAPTALVEMTMQLILEYLPENILKGFFWCNATAFSVDLIRKLYSKQSCVEDVQVVPTIGLAKPYDVEEIAPVYDRLVNNDRRLDLVIDSEASFQLSQYLLQMSSSVQTLRIVLQDEHQDYDFLGPGTHASPRDLPSILVRRLFSIRLRDQIAASVANLQRLELCFVDLVNATAEWNCLVGAHRLKALSLIKCGGTGAFFKKICSRSSVDVEELTLTDHGLKSDRLLEIIEASIVRCDKLKSLALSLMGTDRCIYVDDICQVGSNLELLSVHIFGSDDDSNTEWCWDDEEFAAIIDACPKLKQLSCAFPGVDLLDDPSPSWVTRAVSWRGKLY